MRFFSQLQLSLHDCRLERRQRASKWAWPIFVTSLNDLPRSFPAAIYPAALIKLVTKRNSRHPKLGIPVSRSILLLYGSKWNLSITVILISGEEKPFDYYYFVFFFFNLYSLYKKKKKNERDNRPATQFFPPAYAHTLAPSAPFTPASFSISRSLNYR